MSRRYVSLGYTRTGFRCRPGRPPAGRRRTAAPPRFQTLASAYPHCRGRCGPRPRGKTSRRSNLATTRPTATLGRITAALNKQGITTTRGGILARNDSPQSPAAGQVAGEEKARRNSRAFPAKPPLFTLNRRPMIYEDQGVIACCKAV